MPKGPAPSWTQRKEPVLDQHVKASMLFPMDPETGHYGQCLYGGITSREWAAEIKRGLYRSAQHLKVSMSAHIDALDDGTFQVRYKAINKAHARKYVLTTYGPDRSNWAYDPRAKNKKLES